MNLTPRLSRSLQAVPSARPETHVARVDAPAVAEAAGAELRAVDPVALPAVGGATALLSGDVHPAPLKHGRTQAVCSRGKGGSLKGRSEMESLT